MKDWFANLEQREQWIVGVGGVVIAIIIFWAFIWMPFDRAHRNLETGVDNWQLALSDIRGIAAEGGASAGVAQPSAGNSNQSPVVIVDQTLRERNLNNTVQRRQPVPNGIRVEFENVSFDQLVVWLGDIYSGYGMAVQNGSIGQTNRNGPGRVNATLALERAP